MQAEDERAEPRRPETPALGPSLDLETCGMGLRRPDCGCLPLPIWNPAPTSTCWSLEWEGASTASAAKRPIANRERWKLRRRAQAEEPGTGSGSGSETGRNGSGAEQNWFARQRGKPAPAVLSDGRALRSCPSPSPRPIRQEGRGDGRPGLVGPYAERTPRRGAISDRTRLFGSRAGRRRPSGARG